MNHQTAPVLQVHNLTVQFGNFVAVDNLSFDLHEKETLAIVGESGSGKSVTALSIMRLVALGSRGRITAGEVLFQRADGQVIDLVQQRESVMRSIRGNHISMIFQEPLTSLNPVYTVGDQIMEAIILHQQIPKNAARQAALEMLQRVRIPEAHKRIDEYPHQLSGGMRQRVMIAMALSCDPAILIADEPTTALDVTIQAQILGLIRELQDELNTAVIIITHDMGVVAEVADRALVMNQGKVVESGSVGDIFHRPQDAYTQTLLHAVPRLGSMATLSRPAKFRLIPSGLEPMDVAQADEASVPTELATGNQVSEGTKSDEAMGDEAMGDEAMGDEAMGDEVETGISFSSIALIEHEPDYASQPLVAVEGLTKRFPMRGGAKVHAVENVSLTVAPGETLAVVGESGCGKSTLANLILKLLEPTSGTIRLEGDDITSLSRRAMRPYRRRMQMIFQDPFASLDPRRRVGDSVAQPLLAHKVSSGKALNDRVLQLFEQVGLRAEHLNQYPHQFSGGQRQRICIARALALNPKLLVADEAVSALDVSIQAQVLNLMLGLQEELGLTYLFISHDMAVVERISHRVAVMYLGQIVEIGPRQAIFNHPRHSYTRKLLSAVPIADPKQRKERAMLSGEIPSPIWPADSQPDLVTLREVEAGHFVAEK
ncbi:MAG: ABC transporter ATP-binding protein [Chloroflexota bacterium]